MPRPAGCHVCVAPVTVAVAMTLAVVVAMAVAMVVAMAVVVAMERQWQLQVPRKAVLHGLLGLLAMTVKRQWQLVESRKTVLHGLLGLLRKVALYNGKVCQSIGKTPRA